MISGQVAGQGAPERGPADATLLDAVADLRRDVAATRLPLPLAKAAAAEKVRARLLGQLDDHLLPRLRELSAPAVVVVAGSTGAGKSTLVNSLLRREVSPAGVLRPTTREPVLVHHPADGDLLEGHPLLEAVQVVADDAVPRGLVLVDAPDLDSLLESNRATAHRLLEAADLWVFLTTAARYGDALPWEALERAAARGTAIAMVLNRVAADAFSAVRADLLGRLRAKGMAAVPLFLITDRGPHQGLLDEAAVAPVRRWLTMVAGADKARSVIQRTQRGSLASLQPWVVELADAVQAQAEARAALEAAVREAAEARAAGAAGTITSGGIAAGPVRARWVGLAGPDGPLAGRLTTRRRHGARAAALAELAGELRTSVEIALANARRHGTEALVDALRAGRLPGHTAVVAALTGAGEGPDGVVLAAPGGGRAPAPEISAAAWLDAAPVAVARAAEGAGTRTRRALARLVRGVGDQGAGTLAALAAVGLAPAEAALARVVGPAARDLAAWLREDLVSRAAEQTRAAAEPALAFLAQPDLADDAAATLRLRLAVLKGLR